MTRGVGSPLPLPREHVAGAFVLDAPGTYVTDIEDTLIIGNRPGPLHYCLAIGVPAACLALLMALRDVWWLGAGALVLFGVPVALVAFNTQRYEVAVGRLLMRGRALGLAIHRDWVLTAETAVRVGTRVERDEGSPTLWTAFQAQILTRDGWVAVAESRQRERAAAFAERMARAAGVVLQSP